MTQTLKIHRRHSHTRPNTPARVRWRQLLAKLDPYAATLPVSLHAGVLLSAHGYKAAAIEAYQCLLSADPGNPAALRSLVALARQTDKLSEAMPYLRRLHQSEARDLAIELDEYTDIETFLQAADGVAAKPVTAPPDYVTALFDDYAERFDEHLVKALHYQGPELLYQAVSARLGGGGVTSLLDIGCGTGLAGVTFRPLSKRLDGVDLSEKMISKARTRAVYDHLHVAEVHQFLHACQERYKLIIASDVLTYIGDLIPLFTACRQALGDNGLLAFNAEALPDADKNTGYKLQSTRRYAHHREYIMESAGASGLRVLGIEQAVLRYQSKKPVHAHVCILSSGEE